MLNTSDISVQNLEEVFTVFNKVSADLQESYQDLELQVTELNSELATARSARLKDLEAKERLACKLSTLMEALPGGIIVINKDNIVVDENEAAIAILGHSVLDVDFADVIGLFDTNKKNLSCEVNISNGKHISISTNPYGNDGENIILFTDITESFELNKKVNRDKRLAAMGEMAARLAHQIRTPLSAAILYLSNAYSRKEDADKNTLFKKVNNRLGHIEKLITAMLQYINEGMNSSEQFSLGELLGEVVESSKDRINKYSGDITYSSRCQDTTYSGNRESLGNAVSNLIDNAISVIEEKPEITVTLKHLNNTFVISVSDNGPGITNELKEQIFDPFFSTKCNGTGLGLAVVMSVIKAHQGEILVKESTLGGAMFQISLPVIPEQSAIFGGIWESNNTVSVKGEN